MTINSKLFIITIKMVSLLLRLFYHITGKDQKIILIVRQALHSQSIKCVQSMICIVEHIIRNSTL